MAVLVHRTENTIARSTPYVCITSTRQWRAPFTATVFRYKWTALKRLISHGIGVLLFFAIFSPTKMESIDTTWTRCRQFDRCYQHQLIEFDDKFRSIRKFARWMDTEFTTTAGFTANKWRRSARKAEFKWALSHQLQIIQGLATFSP